MICLFGIEAILFWNFNWCSKKWIHVGIIICTGAMVQPLPSSHLIFRAPSQAAGKCWMDALELALRCSSILLRSMTTKSDPNSNPQNSVPDSKKWNESDYEKHFKDQGEWVGARLSGNHKRRKHKLDTNIFAIPLLVVLV